MLNLAKTIFDAQIILEYTIDIRYVFFSLNPDGITTRGCSPPQTDEFSEDKNDWCKGDECNECTTSKCNGEIFPKNRLHCLHCDGNSCVNRTNDDDVRHPCVRYNSNDECYNIFSHGN